MRIAERLRTGFLHDVVGIPTSNDTAALAREGGIPLSTLEEHSVVDITIDGADEVDPAWNVIKGLGGALLREKIVAYATRFEVMVVDESKLVQRLGAKCPVPVEVLQFGWRNTQSGLRDTGARTVLRMRGDHPYVTDEGNWILDCSYGPIADPDALACQIKAIPGVVEHGLFLRMVHSVVVAGAGGVRELEMRMTGERILVVDDSPEVRGLVGRLCRRDGYLVTDAASGEEALAYLREQIYQIAVVDLLMPGMGGVELLRYIRQDYPWTDVIILTGYGELETAATTLSLGAYYYLQKESFNFSLIPLVVGRMVERQRLAQANEQLIGDLTDANQQLALRREQQLDSVQHISRALAGGLSVGDIASLITRSLSGLIDCDACGVLVGGAEVVSRPLTAIVSRRPLAESASQALSEIMYSACEGLADGDPEVQLSAVMPEGEPDSEPWLVFHTVPLNSRGTQLGVCLVARHESPEFGSEELDILRILGAQGGIALENTYLFARMRDLATRDSLTGLYNHRHYYEILEAELTRNERTGRQSGVIMIDVDKTRIKDSRLSTTPTGIKLGMPCSARWPGGSAVPCGGPTLSLDTAVTSS